MESKATFTKNKSPKSSDQYWWCIKTIHGPNFSIMCQQKLHFIEGEYCETNIDECLSAPCLHGVTCINGINRYACECLIGYFGDTCSHHVCDNDQSPCLNGGVCYAARNGEAVCLCPAGFSGDASSK